MRINSLADVFARYQTAQRIAPICGQQQLIEAGRRVALALRGDFLHG